MLPLEAEDHVVGVEVAARGEVLGGVELDALAQLEGVFQAAIGHAPGFGQSRPNLGGATLELDQPVKQLTR